MPNVMLEVPVEELEKKYKAKARKATISMSGGRYFLKIDGKDMELDPKITFSPQPLQKLVESDPEVLVIYSQIYDDPAIVIFNNIRRRWWILCYVPPPPDMRHIFDREIQTQTINSMIKQKLVSPAFGKYMTEMSAQSRT